MSSKTPYVKEVEAALKEFPNEGMTAIDAASLLGLTVNQASASFSHLFHHNATRRVREGRMFRYFPTPESDDRSKKHENSAKGVHRVRGSNAAATATALPAEQQPQPQPQPPSLDALLAQMKLYGAVTVTIQLQLQ